MASLFSLSIYDCHGTTRFLLKLANDTSVKPPRLKHFALRVPNDSDEDMSGTDIALVQSYLDAIINSICLESLHLSWDRFHLGKYLNSRTLRAPNLLSFSLHDGANDPDFENDVPRDLTLWEETLRDRLDSCPKLHAFGYRMPEGLLSILTSRHNEVRLYKPFMVRSMNVCVEHWADVEQELLQKAPNLRVIHLRQPNVVTVADYYELDCMRMRLESGDAYAFCMQQWASAFFEYLHTRRWCTRLRALVIRCHVVDTKRSSREDRRVRYVPQCCYVKGFQTDMLGRSGVVAVPVTRAILRASEPWADILDYDPECNWGTGQVVVRNRNFDSDED
jgi:hypothetical protein